MGRSLTISTSAAAGERVIAVHDRIEAAEQPRRPNDMARQARGLWTRLRMAWLHGATFRTALLQDDRSSADTPQMGIRRRPAPIP